MRSQKLDDIKRALEEAIAQESDSEATVEKVMQALDNNKILRYHKEHEVSLLSTAGRVLVSIIEDPTMTIRAISIYLDLSETMIEKTVKQLISSGLITKTKVNRQNVYRYNKNQIDKQPDIHNFLSAIKLLKETDTFTGEEKEQSSESSPF